MVSALEQLVGDLQHGMVVVRGRPQLPPELLKGHVRILGHEEGSVGVMDVGRRRVPRHQLLEGHAADRRPPSLRHLEARPSGHEDHLPLLGGGLVGEVGQPQDAEAEGLDDARAVLLLERELAQDLEGGLVALEPVQERRRLVAGHREHFGARDAQRPRLLQLP